MKKPSNDIIQKFYENRCDDIEYQYILKYLNSLDKNELNNFLDEHIKKLENNEFTVEEIHSYDFKNILNEINKNKTGSEKIKKHFPYSIAASIALLVIISIYAIYFIGLFDKPEKIRWNEKITRLGQKSIITLLDGTHITLNAGSKLRYPATFRKSIREVQLEGEAYFEVTPNPEKPFIVTTGEVVTTVLGTKFNVKAYPSETNIKVALLEGKVKVSKNEKDNNDEIYLLPKQQMVYNRKTKSESVLEFDERKVIGWTNNLLVFENEELKDVLVILERAFGINLEIKNKNALKKLISANFEDESFWGIIEVIKYLTDLETKTIVENNELKKVIFYKKPRR